MKHLFKIFLLGSFLSLLPFFSWSQGDCPTTAQVMTQCGFGFTGNNSSATACAGACGGACPACVGSSADNNIDGDCNTDHPSSNCGCDFLGSIENNMFWTFSVTQQCDYQICVTASNCCCTQGAGASFMQVAIFQWDSSGGAINQYHVMDNSNTTICCGNTTCYTVTVNPANGPILLMVDGNAGTECDMTMTVDTVPGTGCVNCTVISLDIKPDQFSAVKSGDYVQLDWTLNSRENLKAFQLERRDSKFGDYVLVKHFESSALKSNEIDFSYIDRSPKTRRPVYRLKGVDYDGEISYSNEVEVRFQPDELFIDRFGPNPLNDILTLEIGAGEKSRIHLEIIDVSGKLMKRSSHEIIDGFNGISLNTAELLSGMYFLRVKDNSGKLRETITLVKH